ncbi:MAG: glutamine synthetase family protein [Pseudomonadota bacterium]
MTTPTGADWSEGEAFLAANPDVQAIDIVLSDLHGMARGKMIRRHELAALYQTGRPMPSTLFAQDVEGDDIDAALATMPDGGGDHRCWPLPRTLGAQPNGRGLVLLQMYDGAAKPVPQDPRFALLRQIDRANASGYTPLGALELEFYLLDAEPDPNGAVQPAKMPLGGRRLGTTNCMSVDELDEAAPFFDALYAAADSFDLPLEALLSEYAEGQFELTLRYRDLARAVDDIALTRHLIRTTARRFGMRACFMAKPFGHRAGSGMHLHLSLADKDGRNLFADTDGNLSPLMLQAIGGIRAGMNDMLLLLAPVLNSWRRMGSAVYSPATNCWQIEDRNVAVRIPDCAPEARHFELRVAGVDANPYLVAAAALGAALDGIEAQAEAGPPGAAEDMLPMPRTWLDAIDAFEASKAMVQILGEPLHTCLCAVKRHEYEKRLADVTETEWRIYGGI